MKKKSVFHVLCILLAYLLVSCKNENKLLGWFPFQPENTYAPSVIDMSAWLDAPAGKHGFVKFKGDKMVFEDGTPVKFWGVNICSKKPYVDNGQADNYTRFLSKYGVNAIRFHKFTYHGFTGDKSTVIDPGLFNNFDYFQSQLKESGIYYGWSPIYGHEPREGDKEKLLAYDEIASADLDGHLSYSTIGLVNFAEDLQNLHIELITNMLRHKNPYTGLCYADDPALSFVELQNEDNIYFATNERMLDLCPTYKDLLTEKFSRWLRDKYKDHANLMNYWGQEAIDWGKEVKNVTWNLDSGNICPVANHGVYHYEYTKYTEMDTLMPVFLLDMANFLHGQQLAFYSRFEDSIRATGYRGPLVGSCWQAGAGISHFYNLHADYVTGIIDRHNYFGGGTGHRLVTGEFKNDAMVSKPGTGLLSTGFQMVADRPFAFSEWMSLPPNEWIAEGPLIIAAYGMGLQGWDASYSFAVDYPYFTSTIHTPGVYNVTSPTQIALYPALASMMYNHDVREGKVISERNVHIPSLAEGKLGFQDIQEQKHDIKAFGGVVPKEALAIGKVLVNFTDAFQPTVASDLSAYHDTVKNMVSSTTEQLKWHYGHKGYFTLNSPGTKAFVGFSNGQKHELGNTRMEVNTPFAVVLLSSLEKGKNLEDCKNALVTTIARVRNSGMEFNEDMSEIIDVGEAPVLMEPVKASIGLSRPVMAVHVLSHTGQRTGKKVPVSNGEILLDGANHKAIYYEIQFK